jgi:hypothetical protein
VRLLRRTSTVFAAKSVRFRPEGQKWPKRSLCIAHRPGEWPKRDRATALFLADTGWAQQEIAARIGRPQSWVAQQIIFAGFLAVSPGYNLLEGHFRRL